MNTATGPDLRLQDYPLASHSAPRATAGPRVPRRLRRMLSLDDFEAAARRHLPSPVFGYVAGGARPTARCGATARPHELRLRAAGAARRPPARTSAMTLFGQRYAAPFGIAPMGLCALSAYRGDLVLAPRGGGGEHPADGDERTRR